jgi:hypothetical protein
VNEGESLSLVGLPPLLVAKNGGLRVLERLGKLAQIEMRRGAVAVENRVARVELQGLRVLTHGLLKGARRHGFIPGRLVLAGLSLVGATHGCDLRGDDGVRQLTIAERFEGKGDETLV